ncbi:hypothetical protein HQ520_14760, partial [bacterium]|nr:hypothetical protein [bacterium]
MAKHLFPIAFLFLLPFLFPGIFLYEMDRLPGADLPEFHLPHQQFIHDNLTHGAIPFWNPYLYGGTPEFGNPEMAPLYPVHLIGHWLLGPEGMLRFKYLFHLGLLAAGAFLLFRLLRAPFLLALAGAVCLQWSGFPITKVVIPNVGDSAAWLPLMLFLNLRFARHPSLRRGFALALAGGIMLLLFFPQITLTLVLLLAITGAAGFVKVNPAPNLTAGQRLAARWLHRFLLPLAEGIFLLSLLRYPPETIRFPDPGWRNAFGGMGRAGLAALVAVLTLWAAWLVLIRLKVRIDWRRLSRWTIGFAGVWLLAGALAAPQLIITGELITRSNQRELAYTQDEDFFTGAQAYGSTRDFIQTSALASTKEPINNMALGPLPWLLIAAGILAGFHRRHRPFLLMVAGAALVFAIYMAAPGLFDLFRRLPFFAKFAGLSRYLAFLNFLMVTGAVLSASLWARSLSRLRPNAKSLRPLLTIFLAAALLLNALWLARHDARFWRRLQTSELASVPEKVIAMVRRHIAPGQRLLVDARGREDYVPLLMLPLAARVEGLGGYGPMRLATWDRWMNAHNESLSASHADYRAALFEPVPTPWTRAMRTRWFLFPPGNQPPDNRELNLIDTHGPWRLFEDNAPTPSAWPETDPDRAIPHPEILNGWKIEPAPPKGPASQIRQKLAY